MGSLRAWLGMVCALALLGCSDDPDEPPVHVSLSGALEKGPFVLGSSVDVAPLDGALNPTGELFSTQTVDDAGRFTIDFDLAGNQPVAIEGNGFYYNEVTGSLSSAPITLRALDEATVSGGHDAFVNVVTHLAFERAKTLVGQGMSVADAETAAEAELQTALHVGPSGFDPGALGLQMTILGGDTDSNAYLLAVSAVLAQAAVDRGGPIDAALQELLNTLALDLAADGTFSTANVDALLAAQQALDPDLIMAQLAARIAAIGSSAVVPDINRLIDSDLDGVINNEDNCRRDANIDQADADTDGIGDVCDAPLTQQAYLKASNTAASDYFGRGTSMSGDTLVVGAPFQGNGGDLNMGSGAVYVFVRSGSTWTQQAYLQASNVEPGDWFGISVSLSGDTLAVGAYGEDSNAVGVNNNEADNSAPYSGAAYVFTRTGTTWTQQAYIKASNTETNDTFGESISVSGDTLIVGTRSEDSSAVGVDGNQADNSALGSGAAYVFTRSGTTWSQQAYLKASNTGASAEFGFQVAASGDTVAVGAISEGGQSGAVYVFTRIGATWTQEAFLKASNPEPMDVLGVSLSLDGDTLAAGAPWEDSAANGVNGDQSSNAASNSGAVYVFRRAGTTWTQQAYIKASNTGSDAEFGTGAAVSGDTLVVGAPREGGSGAAYVFTRSGVTWSQLTYLKASNTEADDGFGNGGVCVSGSTVAIAASSEDSNATGVNGDQADNSAMSSGAVYVFQ